MNSDTIAAVSTAMSPAGIGIVRISGAEAFDIADQIYDSGTKKKAFRTAFPHDPLRLYRGWRGGHR